MSFEREQCGGLQSPFVTPDKCLKAGCCYEDISMDEPELQWYSPEASIWCFKKKSGIANGKLQTLICTWLIFNQTLSELISLCKQVHVAIAVNRYHLTSLLYPYPAEQETVVPKEF